MSLSIVRAGAQKQTDSANEEEEEACPKCKKKKASTGHANTAVVFTTSNDWIFVVRAGPVVDLNAT